MARTTTVLVVDDNKDILRLARVSFRGRDYTAVTAADAETALKLAFSSPPDVILLDVALPGIDGLEALVRLRENKKTYQVPVFMLSSRDTIGDMEEAFELGADDYITKPITTWELREAVARKLRSFRQRMQQGE